MRIIDLRPDDEYAMQQAATLLVKGFEGCAWPNMDEAMEEVQDALEAGNINRIAVDDDGTVLGWVGANSLYEGNVWELHPLVVHPQHQGKGIGRALVANLETQVRNRGGITIYLGTDDLHHRTTLANTDLYPNVGEHIARIKNLCRHPYEFYEKLGYVIVGVIPDANGVGKPDIMMAKRVGG